jgi:hypothetical protein
VSTASYRCHRKLRSNTEGSCGVSFSPFRFLSAAIQYAEAFPAEPRTVPALYAFATKLLQIITAHPMLDEWAINRWQEPLLALTWLLDKHPGTGAQVATVRKLISTLRNQGFDWTGWVASNASHPFNRSVPAPAPAPAPAPLPPTPICAPGINLFGGDLGPSVLMAPNSTSDECKSVCSQHPLCLAYVFESCQQQSSGSNAKQQQPFGTEEKHCYLKAGGWRQEKGDNNPGCTLCSQQIRTYNPAHPQPPEVHRYFPETVTDSDAICKDEWYPWVDRQWTHGVNLMQAAYLWGLEHRLDPHAGWLERGRAAFDKIDRLHGLPTGVPSADECLSGRSPSRGTETCTVVETMMSLGTMFAISGDMYYADKLVRCSFFDRILHSRMPLDSTHVLFKRTCV